tara:strand:+ start:1953 stop:2495 length:543 start_codon:yes stop_codon:yes gene_type:complete
MPDTGWLAPTAYENYSNVAFESVWITDGGGVIIFFASSGTETVKDFSSDTISGTVTGAEVYLQDTYGLSNAAGSLAIQLSKDGGSNFSSAKSTGALGTSAGNNETLGGSSDLWGLDWSGFTDLDQLKVKGTENGGQLVASDFVKMKIYYEAEYDHRINNISNISSINGIAVANLSKVNGV